jgi:HSP20 family protein
MMNSLKQAGKNMGSEITRAWESLASGWHELLSRSGDALTHFTRHKEKDEMGDTALVTFPRWSLLAGELEETEKDVVVRFELPGMDKDDCTIHIEGNILHLSGEKRFERDTSDSTFHVMERAYGAFQRSIALPRNVNVEQAQASFKNGVLTVRLPKEDSVGPKAISVS